MRLFDRINKYVHVQFVAAEIPKMLLELTEAKIELYDITHLDDLTAVIRIRKNRLRNTEEILKRRGCSYKIVARKDGLWTAASILRRPVFWAGMFLFLVLTGFLPGRIFAIRVEGNISVPERYILACAEQCGIRFGKPAREVRSEKVKNEMLHRMPQLQWVGVNTNGCIATIQVKERSMVNKRESTDTVSSITANRDGVICDLTVLKGTPLCTVGQTVQAGDVLISGYTDCGLKVQAQNAEGEVFAYTLHKNTFVALQPESLRGERKVKKTCYWIKIGKNVIKLCNHSGISDTTCVKMYLEEFWTFPGGFQLPISFIRETRQYYDVLPFAEQEGDSLDWIDDFAETYLQQRMIAGEILAKEQHLQVTDSDIRINGSYSCREMIGQVKYEETIERNAEDN